MNVSNNFQRNKCYDNNLPTGVQNVSNCKMKAPAYLSRPHFDKADSFYARQFQLGVHPETEKHDSHFLIEPHTSVPLEVNMFVKSLRRHKNVQVKMALQLNIKIEKSEGMEYIFKDLPTVYFPILWFESSFEVNDIIAGALRLLVNIPTIMKVASILGILAGIVGIYIIYRQISPKVPSDPRDEKKSSYDGKLNWLKRIPALNKMTV